MRAVNLIPSEDRAGSAIGGGRSGGGAYAVLGVAGGLAILALLYGMAKHQISDRQAQAASLTARAQHVESEAAQLAPYTSFMALREQRMHAVSELIDARFDWAHAFQEISRVLPADVSVSSLDGSVGSGSEADSAPAASTPAKPATPAAPAATPTASGAAGVATVASATPPGSVPTFTLTGCATSQQEVARTLQHLRLMDGVSEVALQSSTKSGSTAGGSGGGGGCEGNYPAFTVQISFSPLPSSATITSVTKLTSATGAAR
jgi:hypothetical protein